MKPKSTIRPMQITKYVLFGALVSLAMIAASISCSDERTIIASPDTTYYSDIRFIFDATCSTTDCHGGASPAVELGMTTYDDIFRGSINGSILTPGNAENSLLYRTVAGTSDPAMPIDEKLSPSLIDSIGKWIDDGAFQNREGNH